MEEKKVNNEEVDKKVTDNKNIDNVEDEIINEEEGLTTKKIVIAAIVVFAILALTKFNGNTILKIILALIVFSVIVLFHEFGHFLLAKKNGIGVTDFSIGMGPRIWGFKKGGTMYSLRCLPIGGSCMMVGEDQELDRDDAFNKKGVWARISVIAAGPIFNFILAFVLALFVVGISGWDFAKIEVMNDMPAQEAGLQTGDIITEIDGHGIINARDLAYQLQMFHQIKSDNPVSVVVLRNGEKKNLELIPTPVYVMTGAKITNPDEAVLESVDKDSPFDKAGIKAGDKIIGINGTKLSNVEELVEYLTKERFKQVVEVEYLKEGETDTTTTKMTLTKESGYMIGITYSHSVRDNNINALEIVKYSGEEVGFLIKTTVQSLGYLLSGQSSRKDIAGPVGIVNIIGDNYEAAYEEGGLSLASLNMINISILLSANIGVMNLLPIPALDGGRLIFLFLEAIRRKPIKPEVEGMIHATGLILLFILMIFIFFNDIANVFGI